MASATKTLARWAVLAATLAPVTVSTARTLETEAVLFEDAFTGDVGPGWSWVRAAPEDRRVRDGTLEVRVRPGNLWGRANDARNVLLRDLPPVEGSVAFEVTVANEPSEQWEQVGIAWYRDDSNMVKLVKERVDGTLWVVMGREENDRTRTLAKVALETPSVELRLEVRDSGIAGSFRPEGEETWRDAAHCDLPAGSERPKISLQVYNGPRDAEHWARFSNFRVLSERRGDASVKEMIGVNIHFTGAPERDLTLLAEAGFGWVRMDFVWQAVERTRGEYRFDAYDQLVEGLSSRGIRALFILDYSNRLYETQRSVRTAEGRAAFARFAAAAAGRYRGRGIRWEVWNEPNIEKFWAPEPSAADYLELVREVAPAVRAADPGATILGPATSGIPWDYLGALFEKGFLALVDEVSVHPYRGHAPETVLADYARLRELIQKHTPPGSVARPIVSGEWGYSNHHWGRRISTELQAAYLARQFLTNLSADVRLSIWYDWANDGTDPNEAEHNFGTVTAGREPKTAYLAVKTLTATLGDARFERRLESPAGTHVLAFSSPDARTTCLAAWSEKEMCRVRLAVPGLPGSVRVVELTGAETVVETADGALELIFEPEPRYVRLPADVARQARVVAAR